MFTIKFSITLSKHTYLKMMIIQIQSFEFLITPSKETLNAMPTL
jgi:hypothetical protein